LSDKFDSGDIYYQNEISVRAHWNVEDLEKIEAVVASHGVAKVLESFPVIRPLDVDNSSLASYFTWYDKGLLCLNGMKIEDDLTLNKLRLRPEGYAYYELADSLVYPIITGKSRPNKSNILNDLEAIIVKEKKSDTYKVIFDDCPVL